MKVIDTAVADVKIIEPTVLGDERGFFMETFRDDWFREKVADVVSGQGILRGLHYQTQQTQGKLVRVIAGEVYDVAVDMRKDSPTFGQHIGVLLSGDNKRQLWVPTGFAHGFYVTSDCAEFVYKCTDYYAPKFEQSVLWNDPALNIQWPLVDDKLPLLSAKDKAGLLHVDAPAF
jgi:dTDP-4-dehydrorhamnose 3,5-epimerase